MGAVQAGSTCSWRVIYLSILLLLYIALTSCDSSVPAGSPQATVIAPGGIRITVKDNKSKEELEDRVVVVRTIDPLQADDNKDSILSLPSCTPQQDIYAWSPGYYIGEIECDGRTEYSIELEAFDAADNINYNWFDANLCGTCHSTI